MLKESIKMSWSNIINNKMRSFLTVLGVVIGVASIISLITLVSGATNTITDKVSALGANMISVQVKGTPLKMGLVDSDIQELSELENISGASPTISAGASVVVNGMLKEDVTVQGKNEVYFSNTEDLMEAGREINVIDIQNQSKVCIIGANIKKELFFGENPMKKEILINGITYKVIGTMQESEGFSMSSKNDIIIIPYTTVMSVLHKKHILSVDLYMADSNKSDEITKNIEAKLNQAFNNKENSFTITNMQDMLATLNEVTSMMTLLLAGIASISLVVGGIGIMNMMLVSVTERTTEIGLRKALGAEPRIIKQQFLLEAMFLSLFGGIVGLLFGVLIAYVASMLIGITLSISISTIAIAIGFSMTVGIIFGLAPASKASKLNPIDALRSI